REKNFQIDIIKQMVASGWQEGNAAGYNRETALYEQDVIGFVKDTQQTQWQAFCAREGEDAEQKLLAKVVKQLKMANSHDSNKVLREYGTLGVLRKGVKTLTGHFKFCQFKPEHDLNQDTQAAYANNRFTIVQELVYSPYASAAHQKATGSKSKRWRIDLVLFVNGFAVATLELKSEFKQDVEQAIVQYKQTRLPKDPQTNKPEPLLSFKRGALVHFAVSQYQVYMTTRLDGDNSTFLPFNKGTKDGGAGNDVPKDPNEYITGYLWQEVLAPDSLLNILSRFMHLQIEDKEDHDGRKYKKETMIFPRYHQLNVVNKLLTAAHEEGTGNRYLIQHSAGSGKSNSIAWIAHQLSSLHLHNGEKMFHSVVVITDRTVLDDQLQDTIGQFQQVDGVVNAITANTGTGSKSEKLAEALKNAAPIIIVTIQTFSYVVDAIEHDVELSQRRFAVIADEAHSSQTGRTAIQLKNVLKKDADQNTEEVDFEDQLAQEVELRKKSPNLNYYAFTATPKDKTLQLFGRLPKPDLPPSKTNLPKAFDYYQMRQAIEEGFILDVLQNYTSYKVAYNLAQKVVDQQTQVDGKKAKVKLNQWVKLVEHNVAQKVKVIVEHFKDNVMGLLEGQAKAMVVTGSRKEAVRYKLEFDKYVYSQGYHHINAMIAFSGEVTFDQNNDPDSIALLDETYTETSMNPNLNRRKMTKAFDSDDYQVMLVANKFQTGFDQPKLLAMYVDKKLGGVECVQTLSRLNRVYPGKKECGTFVLDFINEPEVVLEAFQQYYQEVELEDVSDPDLIFKLETQLNASGIYTQDEVDQLAKFYYEESKSYAALSSLCKPALDRWQSQYSDAVTAWLKAKDMFERLQSHDDEVVVANAQNDLDECTKVKDQLELFKKDLGSYVRFYEFMSQIVDYSDSGLEKLSLYARCLRPLLKVKAGDEDQIDLSNVAMSHYRISKNRQQALKLKITRGEFPLKPTTDIGSAKPRSKQEEFLAHIIERLNGLFITDGLSNADLVNYAYTIRDKLSENKAMMLQLLNNTREQAMLGDFPEAFEEAVIEAAAVHGNLSNQVLDDPEKLRAFVLDWLLAEKNTVKPDWPVTYDQVETIDIGHLKIVLDGEFDANSYRVADAIKATLEASLMARLPASGREYNLKFHLTSIRPGSLDMVFGMMLVAAVGKFVTSYPKIKLGLQAMSDDIKAAYTAINKQIGRIAASNKLGKIKTTDIRLLSQEELMQQLHDNEQARREFGQVAEPGGEYKVTKTDN
ncbi:MAG: type I restriction enzyme R subunit, partial [Phenylobacterium sp.]